MARVQRWEENALIQLHRKTAARVQRWEENALIQLHRRTAVERAQRWEEKCLDRTTPEDRSGACPTVGGEKLGSNMCTEH